MHGEEHCGGSCGMEVILGLIIIAVGLTAANYWKWRRNASKRGKTREKDQS